MKGIEEIYQKVKEYVSQEQEKQPKITGLSLEDISREINITEERILLALSHKALFGELVGTDIIICFEEEDNHEEGKEGQRS